jgi:MFS family permease
VAGAGFYGLLTYLSLFLQGVLGYDATAAGLAFLPVILPYMAASLVAGRLLARVGSAPLAVTGLLAFASGMLLLWTVGGDAACSTSFPGSRSPARAGGGRPAGPPPTPPPPASPVRPSPPPRSA